MSAEQLIQYLLEERYQQIRKGELKKPLYNTNLKEGIEAAIEPAIEVVAEPVVKAIAEPVFNFTKAAMEKLFGTGAEVAVKAATDPFVVHNPAEAPVVRATPTPQPVQAQPTPNVKPFATYKPFKLDIPTTYPIVKVEPEVTPPTKNPIVKVEPKEVHIPDTEEFGQPSPKEFPQLGEPKTETETKTEKETERKRLGQTDTETETQTELKRLGKTDTETETQTEPKRLTKTETKTETKTKTETEPKTETETEPKTEEEIEKPTKTKPRFRLPLIFPSLGGSSPQTSLYAMNPKGAATNIGLGLGVESIGTFARRQVMR
jgi:hypothetical protein